MSSRSTDSGQPLRPSLPLVGWIGAGLWVGVVIAEWAVWHSLGYVSVVLVVAGLLLCAGTLRRRTTLGLAFAGVVAGLGVGWLAWTALDRTGLQLDQEPPSRYAGTCVSDAKSSDYSDRTVVVLDTAPPVRVEVAWEKGIAPESGTRVEFAGRVRPDERDEWSRRRHRSGVARSIQGRDLAVIGWSRTMKGGVGPVRERAIARVQMVQGPGGDLLAGVTLGDRRRLTGTPTEEDFRTAGLTHLVAVSGSHLVVVAALVGWVAGALKLRRTWSLGLVALVGGCYVVITGVQPSAARAWMMACIVGLAGPGGRRSDALAALGVAVCATLVVRPFAAFDVGFQLSVAAVSGLVLHARLVQTWLVHAAPRWLQNVAEPLAVTVTAQLATVPLIASTFGSVSLVAPASNLVAAPLISLVLLLGIVGLLLCEVFTPAGELVLHVAGWFGGLVARLAGWFAALPWAAVPLELETRTALIAGAFAAAVSWAAWPRATRMRARAGAALVCLALVAYLAGPRPPSGAVLVVMDVGQGDAIMIRDGPRAALVDAGAEPSVLRDALRRNGVRSLDALVVTHFHDDHYGGAAALRQGVTVSRVLVTVADPEVVPVEVRSLNVPIHSVGAGDRFQVGRMVCEIVSPADGVDPATNEASIVMTVRGVASSALLTGDAEAPVVEPLVAEGTLHPVDILKVGHHGSRPSVSDALLQGLSPSVALISVGEDNRYGHPNPKAMGHLSQHGVKVRRTDTDGDLTVPLDGGADTGQRRTAIGGHSCERLYLHVLAPFTPQGDHVCLINRAQTDLLDSQRARLLGSAGRGPPEVACWRDRRSRFQHAGVRR